LSNLYLSIIIPAYNEEERLPNTLEQALNFVYAQSYGAEVIIVENGSQDNTLRIAQEFAAQHPHIRVFQEKNKGKGLAVKRGMIEARGEYRFMCDADLSMPITEINRFLPPLLEDFDVAIASREAPGSVRYDEPLYRHLGGRAVNTMIRAMALPGLHDTQCGFKCFRAYVAEDLFACQTIAGWSFDVEILYVARLRGYRIIEVPIPWYFDSETKLQPARDTFRLFRDILQIRRNHKLGIYNKCAEE